MRKHIFFLFTLVLLSSPVACSGTLEVEVDQTPTPEHPAMATLFALPTENAHLATPVTALITPTPTSMLNLGKVAYVQGGDIWVRVLPNGEPQRLATDGRNHSPRWSPSGQWLLFQKEQALWVMKADGSHARPLTAPQNPIEAAWSPMEDRLAYITAQGGLIVTDAEGTTETWLIPDATPDRPEQVERFAWNPNGQWLACLVAQWADRNVEKPPARQILRVIRADGQERADLFMVANPMENSVRLAGWSGEGTHVLFWQGPASASIQADGLVLLSIPVSGGQPQTLAVTMLLYADFIAPQPTTSWLALVIGDGRETWQRKQLVVMEVNGQSSRSLSGTGQAVSSPVWSPGDQQIAYVAMPAVESMASGEEARKALNERRIWVVRADSADKRQITNDLSYRDERPLWSADGGHILFARIRDGWASLWLMRSDGSELQQVVEELPPAPDWFGYYGHVEWGQLFDWWTGLTQIPERPVLLPTATSIPKGNLSLSDESGGAAQQVVVEFLQAVLAGDVEKALGYWNLQKPDQPDNYAEFIRQLVSQWAMGGHHFLVGETTYGGLVAPHDYRTLDEDDPRVQGALVTVRIDDQESAFDLEKSNGRWQISGWIGPGTPRVTESGLIYVKEDE